MGRLKEVYCDVAEMLEANCTNGFIIGMICRDYGLPLYDAVDLVEDVRTSLRLQNESGCYESEAE